VSTLTTYKRTYIYCEQYEIFCFVFRCIKCKYSTSKSLLTHGWLMCSRCCTHVCTREVRIPPHRAMHTVYNHGYIPLNCNVYCEVILYTLFEELRIKSDIGTSTCRVVQPWVRSWAVLTGVKEHPILISVLWRRLALTWVGERTVW